MYVYVYRHSEHHGVQYFARRISGCLSFSVPVVDTTMGDGEQAPYTMAAAGADILADNPCLKVTPAVMVV